MRESRAQNWLRRQAGRGLLNLLCREYLNSRLFPVLEVRLQPVDGVAPGGGRRPANGILISKKADFAECLAGRYGVEPVDTDEILGAVGIVGLGTKFRRVVQDLDRRAIAGRRMHGEVVHGLYALSHAADADVASLRDLHPYAIARRKKFKRLAVPTAAASADEPVDAGVVPRTIATKGDVVFAVPWLFRAAVLGGDGDVGLGLARIDEPGTAEEFFGAVLEDLEEENVDRDVAGVEVLDDPLGGIVQFGGDEDDLVRFVECFRVQRRAEVFRVNADGLFVLFDMSESEMLELASIDCKVAIAEVFAGIDFVSTVIPSP